MPGQKTIFPADQKKEMLDSSDNLPFSDIRLMKPIRKRVRITDNSITFQELRDLNGQEVEVIVLSPVDSTSDADSKRKESFFKHAGQAASGFTDTSKKVDQLVYGA